MRELHCHRAVGLEEYVAEVGFILIFSFLSLVSISLLVQYMSLQLESLRFTATYIPS
jgi:hypothetical protein